MKKFYQFLADHHIEYKRHDHPAVFTVEEAEWLVPPLPGAKSKNLFLEIKEETVIFWWWFRRKSG